MSIDQKFRDWISKKREQVPNPNCFNLPGKTYPTEFLESLDAEIEKLKTLLESQALHTECGWEKRGKLALTHANRLAEALSTRCMCWPKDDPRHTRNPCDACQKVAAFRREFPK